jgi:AAA15 family ATPase/GTPase
MVNSVSFKNFRGLSDLTVPLSQFTMLTGTNGVGKTSVLEGLFCLFSSTRLDVAALTRYSPVGVKLRRYDYRLFWDECFFFDEPNCNINAVSDKNVKFEWLCSAVNSSELINNPMIYNREEIIDDRFINFTWKNSINDEKESVTQFFSTRDFLHLSQRKYKANSECLFFDFTAFHRQPDSLSLEKSKKLTEALKLINQQITDVRYSGGKTGISVIIDDRYERSLQSIGGGIVIWFSLLSLLIDLKEKMTNQEKDNPVFLLIDEMGSGIHYSIMKDIWKYIKDFSAQNPQIQFVFTTHSDDSIRSYCEVFKDENNANIVRLHRRYSDKKIIPTEYKKEQFVSIANDEWEVRG